MGEAAEQLHDSAMAVWHLERVIAKKRDPLSHELFIAVVRQVPAGSQNGGKPPPALPCDSFW